MLVNLLGTGASLPKRMSLETPLTHVLPSEAPEASSAVRVKVTVGEIHLLEKHQLPLVRVNHRLPVDVQVPTELQSVQYRTVNEVTQLLYSLFLRVLSFVSSLYALSI